MRIRTIAMAGLAGAAVAYLLDPIAGGARRRRIREQITGLTRRLTMPERTPPLPTKVMSAPTMEAVADTPEVPTKDEVADTTEAPTKAEVADTLREPMDAEAIATPEVPTKDEVVATPEVPTKDDVVATTEVPTKDEVVATPEVPTKDEVVVALHDPTTEDVANAPQERPRNVTDMPRERMKGYLADIREDRPMDDATIASLVRTRVLGRPDLDTGSLDVEVVQGVAFLRGDLKDKRQIDEVVDLTGAVPGVQEVQNLIHLPESPTGSETATPLGDAWNG